MSTEIRHLSKSRSKQHGSQVFRGELDIASDPVWQPTIRRLGESVGDINASCIHRTEYVLSIATALRALAAAR